MSGLAIDLDVLFFLLGLHMRLLLAQLVHKNNHVLMLPDLLHHEPTDLLIANGQSVDLLKLGQDLE